MVCNCKTPPGLHARKPGGVVFKLGCRIPDNRCRGAVYFLGKIGFYREHTLPIAFGEQFQAHHHPGGIVGAPVCFGAVYNWKPLPRFRQPLFFGPLPQGFGTVS